MLQHQKQYSQQIWGKRIKNEKTNFEKEEIQDQNTSEKEKKSLAI